MHPSHLDLRRFVTGQLNEPAAETIVRHLESCAQCETLLADLDASEDELLASLSSVHGGSAADRLELDPAAQRFAARLGRLPFPRPASPVGSPPDQFGEYRLGPLLGRGGMGLVYQAHHRTLDRVVAVKFLPPRPESEPSGRVRFLHEARAMAKLRHPRLVSALDGGCDGPWNYLVMEFLDGLDFDRLARRVAPLEVADTCEMIRQAAEGLAALHAHGLVHRDLKPSNLMLVAQPSGPPAVKVLDLGLSRWLPTESSQHHGADQLTVEGQWLGTLDYVAPEQLKDARQTRPPADLYALGATLHTLLVGRPIWLADNDDPLPTRIARRLTDRPQLGFDTRSNLPSDLVRLTTELLSTDPLLRPTTEQVIKRLTPWCSTSDLTSLYGRATSTSGEGLKEAQRDDPGQGVAPLRTAPKKTPPTRLGVRAGIVALAALTVVAMGLVIRLAVPRGEIVIKSDAPEITVLVTRDAQPVGDEFVVGGSKSVKWCRAGEYRIELRGVDAADYEVRNGTFTLSRNGEAVVEITRRTTPLTSVAASGLDGAAAPALPTDRRSSILAVLSHGGTIELEGVEQVIGAANSLPREIPVVRNLTIRGADWPELTPQTVVTMLKHIGLIQNGLWFDRVEMDAETLARLGHKEPFASLQLLMVGQCQLEDPGDLDHFRHLRGLGFPNTRLSDRGVRRLAVLPGLRTIDLTATQITDDGLLSLVGIPFQQVVLGGNRQLTDRSLIPLAANAELESLTLTGTRVTDRTIASLAKHQTMTGLYLNNTAITDDGIGSLATIPNLRYLALNDTRVTSQGVVQLTTLPLLDLWLNELKCVDDAVVKQIAEIRTLKNLSLSRTSITDRGTAELRRLPNLRLLFLTGTQLTDESVASLAECRQLQQLFVPDTQLTSAACARLRELLPNCNVVSQ